MAAEHARERAVVLAAVSGVLDRCWVTPGELRSLDWRWLMERLGERGLCAYLHAEASRVGIVSAFPPEIVDQLRDEAEQNAVRSALLQASLLRAAAVLDAGGVEWMPLKGGAIGLVLPDYAAVRNTSDLDLLVRPDQVDRAAELLAHEGTVVSRAKDGFGRELSVEKADVLHVHHLWMLRDRHGVLLELHHSVPGAQGEATRGIWSRAEVVTARGQRVRGPSMDDLLGMVCTHVLGHHRDDGRLVLRHLADVRALAGAGASVVRAAALHDRRGFRTVAESEVQLREAAAYATRSAGRACAASRALDRASAHGGLRGWTVRAGENGRRLVRRLRASGLEAVLPSRAKMLELYGPVASGPALPVLHLHRWVAVLIRSIRAR